MNAFLFGLATLSVVAYCLWVVSRTRNRFRLASPLPLEEAIGSCERRDIEDAMESLGFPLGHDVVNASIRLWVEMHRETSVAANRHVLPMDSMPAYMVYPPRTPGD